MAQKKNGDAEELFEKALQKNPRKADSLAGLIHLSLIQRQPAKALARIQQIAKEPTSSDYYLLLGQVQGSMNNLAGAEQSFAKAVELNNSNVDAILALATTEFNRGVADEAAANLQRAIQLNPRDVHSYFLLARLEDPRAL
jgi:cytochrome c-type biogenesis protein CcmH/NrfG